MKIARDSAGFLIVSSDRRLDSLSTLWTVPSVPTLRIGEVQGAEQYMLSGVTSVARLESGHIAVANGQPLVVRLYDSTGTFIKDLGRRGKGPGEYEQLERVAPGHGDTVVVLTWPGEVLRFSVANGFVDRKSYSDSTQVVAAPPGARIGISSVFANGSLVLSQKPPVPEGKRSYDEIYEIGRMFREPIALTWVSADRSRVVQLGDFGDMQQIFVRIGSDGRASLVPPSSRRLVLATGGPSQSRFCASNVDQPEVRCVDRDGRGFVIRWRQEAVETAESEVNAWKGQRTGGVVQPGGRDVQIGVARSQRVDLCAIRRETRAADCGTGFNPSRGDGRTSLWLSWAP